MSTSFIPPSKQIADVIPEELKRIDRWLLWRAVPQIGKKPRKVPYYTEGSLRSGQLGSESDISQLASFESTLSVYRSAPANWAGIGFALIKADGIGAVDIDNVIADGSFDSSKKAALQVLQISIESGCYIEKSPSGCGIRILGHTAGFTNITQPVEAYSKDRYVTVTGDLVTNPKAWANVDPAIAKIQLLASKTGGRPARLRESHIGAAISRGAGETLETAENSERVCSALAALDPDMPYPEWIRVIFALRSTQWSCAEDIANAWSAGGDPSEPTATRYNRDEFHKCWSSVRADGGIKLGTLFMMAKDQGWRPASATAIHGAKDIRNGRIFAKMHRDKLVKVIEDDQVLRFTSRGWTTVEDSNGDTIQAAIEVVDSLTIQARQMLAEDKVDESQKLNKHIALSSTEQRLRAMTSIGWSESGMNVSARKLDAEPYLLGVQNGILDLRSRQLIEPRPNLWVTKRAATIYDPVARCPLFEKFLAEVQPDQDMQEFLLQVAGTFLVGLPCEQRLYFLYGTGANGKSTFMELIAWMLGEYAKPIQTEMLMRHQRNPEAPSAEMACLKGLRLAYCNEVPEGGRLDEARVKQLTGGDTITARIPYAKQPITFEPSHGLVMTGNHQPDIRDMSDGLWRRLTIVGFDQSIQEHARDRLLLAKLKEEGPGILNRLLGSLANYQMGGLNIPAGVRAATEIYRTDMDIVGQWLDELCAIGRGFSACKTQAYDRYHVWATNGGHRPMSQAKFTRRLRKRGYPMDAGKRSYQGFEIISNTQHRPLIKLV